MHDFNIPNMTCSHCVRAITEAVRSIDPQAQVQTDLAQHQVHVTSPAARAVMVAALTDAGYTPTA
jgi:copper chaperone